MKRFKKHSGYLIMVLAAAVGLGLLGCAGDPAGSDDALLGSQDRSELVVSLTDAAGDFASYTVDVLSLTLTRADGIIVSTLPLSTRVDFAQYTDMTEFLTVATVPVGVYTSATLELDYSDADIRVENASGEVVAADAVVDEYGDPVTALAVSVHLEGVSRLLITPGVPAHLTLDFDLQASNTVAFDAEGLPTVMVEPNLVAEVNPEAPKIHRVRGPLQEVDVAGNQFKVMLRPFRHAMAGTHHRFGTLTVTTDNETVFDIDGTLYKGARGLEALNAMPGFTAMTAVGDLTCQPHRFRAREVYAGSSVPGGTLDVVTGSVLSRSDDALVIKGATLIRSDGSVVFNDRVSVQLGDGTIVKKQFSPDMFSTADISPGQRIRVFGTLSNTSVESLEMDAADGWARLLLTALRGYVVGTDSDATVARLTLDLHSINCRPVDLFDFSGTGVDPDNDADPGAYQINTGELNIEGLTAQEAVHVLGFMTPFGSAPADFDARTVADPSFKKAYFKVDWQPPTPGAFAAITGDSITLNLDGVSRLHHLVRGRVEVDLTTFPRAPVLQPRAEGTGVFVLVWRGTEQLFFNFNAFTVELAARLDSGQAVSKLFATGAVDDATVTLTADTVTVQLQ